MNPIEDAFIVACLRSVQSDKKRKVRRPGELGTAPEIADLLFAEHSPPVEDPKLKDDPEALKSRVIEMMHGKSVGEDVRAAAAAAGRRLIRKHWSLVFAKVVALGGANAGRYLESVVNESAAGPAPDPAGVLAPILQNWMDPPATPKQLLRSGAFQLFRRHKPTFGDSGGRPSPATYDAADPNNHVVAVELLYLDTERFEAVLVTDERAIYRGALYFNLEDTLLVLLQRRTPTNGVNHRVLSLRLDRSEHPAYPGLCMKTGDTSHRPVATECILAVIPHRGHKALYGELTRLLDTSWDGKTIETVPEDSVCAEYVTDRPPPYKVPDPHSLLWEHVRFVSQFPLLQTLSAQRDNEPPLFREPVRAMEASRLSEFFADEPIEILRIQRIPGGTKA